MDAQQKAALLAKIEKKIRYLKEDIADLEEATKPIAPENAIGRVSRMDAINSKSVNEAALRSARAKLIKLEEALTGIDDPNFGRCGKCGGAIQIPRLLLMPESDRCVVCAKNP